MEMRILLLCVLGISFLSTCAAFPGCEGDKIRCEVSGRCVPLNWKCDGDSDCGENDLTDEENCPPVTCSEDEFICKSDKRCVPFRWFCDGEHDCVDGSDEDEAACSNKTCKEDEFQCGDKVCIALNWKCDGGSDCSDESDEKNCEGQITCLSHEFRCNDGRCINANWHCDGDVDCQDESDEMDCSKDLHCNVDEFLCHNNTKCIGNRWRCDGDFDCPDHSDEMDCDSFEDPTLSPLCESTDFMCTHTKECIHKSWKCDGDFDCEDFTDEGPDCEYHCDEGKFQCDNHHCIPNLLRCDHNEDCIDGSDEHNCTFVRQCTLNEFDCYGDGTVCIAKVEVCDGSANCENGEDESPDLCKETKPCLQKDCGEHGRCVDLFNGSAVCECLHGFRRENGFCKDINECEESKTPVCSQQCTNTDGGYRCDCFEGYQLEGHWGCVAAGEKPWLFYANRRDIRRLRVDSRYMEVIVGETDNSIALDVDFNEKLIFWTDSAVESIKSAPFDDTTVMVQENSIKNVIQTGITSPDGIAVDWLYKHFYWTDSGTNTISVANYDGVKRRTLVSSNLYDPRAICLDPVNGYMYWTDWGAEPKIERSGMDGQDRKVIVDQDYDIAWPNGLTIDYIGKRIYWIDAKLHKIGSANLNGEEIQEVIVDHYEIKRPFSISVFEDNLYWTDWSTNSIKSVNKLTGGNKQTLSIGSYSVMDIKVVHELRQTRAFADQAKELCKNASCEYMCLPAAKTGTQPRVSCVCADNFHLKSDQRSCVAGVPATTEKPVTTKAPVVTTEPGYTVVPTVNENTTESGHPKPTPEENTGIIAIITGVVVLVVLVIIAALGILLYRKYNSKHKKSTSFDNPVYRKTTTTEEHCMIPEEKSHMEPMMSDRHETV